jgi:hypothetical protein
MCTLYIPEDYYQVIPKLVEKRGRSRSPQVITQLGQGLETKKRQKFQIGMLVCIRYRYFSAPKIVIQP